MSAPSPAATPAFDEAVCLATADGMSVVRFSGKVSYAASSPYAVTGSMAHLLEDKKKMMIVNMAVRTLSFPHVPLRTCVYDHYTHKATKLTEAGRTVMSPAHPHLHWKERVNAVSQIADTLTDEDTVHVFVFDMGPSDEMFDPNIEASMRAMPADDTVVRTVVFLQDDQHYIYSIDGLQAAKRARMDFPAIMSRVIVGTVSVPFRISPAISLDTDVTFFNTLFGAYKLGIVQNLPRDASFALPAGFAVENEYLALADASNYVVNGADGITYGSNSKTVMFRLHTTLKPEDSAVWTITLIGRLHSDEESVSTKSVPHGHEIVSGLLHMAKNVEDMTHAVKMMQSTAKFKGAFANALDLERIWMRRIDAARLVWNKAITAHDSHACARSTAYAAAPSIGMAVRSRLHSIAP